MNRNSNLIMEMICNGKVRDVDLERLYTVLKIGGSALNRRMMWTLCIIIALIAYYIVQYNTNISIFTLNGSWTLKNHKYNISSNETNILYVITSIKPIMKFQKINCVQNGTISISIPQKTKFIISLPANKTIAKRWQVETTLADNNTVKYVRNNFSNPIVFRLRLYPHKGESYRRQNFYFESVGKGNCELKLNYNHMGDSDSTYDYYIKVNVKVE